MNREARRRGGNKRSDYEFDCLLGEGAVSRVYAATAIHTRKRVAVKIIQKNKIPSKSALDLIITEKKVLSRLRPHPNIVSLKCTFQDDAYLYFVLDYVEKGTLADSLSRMSGAINVNPDLITYWICDIVNMLLFLRGNGVAHRDVKTDNILIDGHNRLRLIDFNCALILLEPSSGSSEQSSRPSSSNSAGPPPSSRTLPSATVAAPVVARKGLCAEGCGTSSDTNCHHDKIHVPSSVVLPAGTKKPAGGDQPPCSLPNSNGNKDCDLATTSPLTAKPVVQGLDSAPSENFPYGTLSYLPPEVLAVTAPEIFGTENPVFTKFYREWCRRNEVFLSDAASVSGSEALERRVFAGDIWAAGCVVFELICGSHPFKGANDVSTTSKILEYSFSIPNAVPELYKDLLKRMLAFEVSHRITAEELSSHPALEHLDLDAVATMTNRPPIVPIQRSQFNSSSASHKQCEAAFSEMYEFTPDLGSSFKAVVMSGWAA